MHKVDPEKQQPKSDLPTVFSPPPILYVLSTCPVCNELKRLLNQHGIDYRLIEVDLLEDEEKKNAMRDLKSVNRMMSFPTTVAGDTVVAGYKKNKIMKLFHIQQPSILKPLKSWFAKLSRKSAHTQNT